MVVVKKMGFMSGIFLLAMLGIAGAMLGIGGTDSPPVAESSSVRITVDGQPTKTEVVEGDVIQEGEKVEGEDCGIPDVTIEMAGDVRRVRVGVDAETCDLILEEVVLNPDA